MIHTQCARWIVLSLLLTLGGGVQAQETPKAAGPRLEISQDRFEFEPVPEGQEVTHQFSVKNNGNAPLLIERVRTG